MSKSRFVIIKTRVPDCYDGADVAVIEVTENLVLMLDKRIAMTKAMFEGSFYGTRWWDYTPYFVSSDGPESFGVDMSEEDFESNLDANFFIPLPEGYETPDDIGAPIDTLILTISVVKAARGSDDVRRDAMAEWGTMVGFQWSGYDKHVGDAGRVTTYEMTETTIDEWAELIGCTEMLQKVRRCRGEE